MRTFFNITTILLLLCSAPGCSRFKQLTRRDYASLNDPFTSNLSDDETVARLGSEQVKSPSAAGVARVDGNTPVRPRSQNTATVSHTTDSTAAPINGKFAGVQSRGMGDVIGQASGPSLSDFVGRTAESNVASSESQATNGNMSEFTAFLEEQAEASGLTETANDLDEDFAQWAAAEKQDWQRKMAAVEEKATPVVSTIQQVSQSNPIPSPSGTTAAATRPNLNQAMYAREADKFETATPLIQQWPAVPTMSGTATAKVRSAVAPEIGTENPFAELQAQRSVPAVATPAKPVAASEPVWEAVAQPQPTASEVPDFDFNEVTPAKKDLDTGFNFDTGWRPSNFEQP